MDTKIIEDLLGVKPSGEEEVSIETLNELSDGKGEDEDEQ